MKSFFSMALVCVLTAAVLSSCSPAPVSSAPASSLQEASSTAASSQIVPSSTSSQALSAQKLVFHPEYMRQTISQYGYIDTDGVLHWNPDFIERELIRDYGLNDYAKALQELTKRSGAVSFCVAPLTHEVLVLWEDSSMTALKAVFSPMADPGITISKEEWGKVLTEEHENVAAFACAWDFPPVYLKKDGSVWSVFEEEPERSDVMQVSFDPFDSSLDVLTEGGTLEAELIERLQTEKEQSEAASWQDVVQVMSYDMIVYALHADGSLTRVRKKDYPYGDADANYPWPAEPVNVVRLFPGTGWYLTADGTLYHIDTKNEFPSKKKIAGMQEIDQILPGCSYALMKDGSIRPLAPQESEIEALSGWLNSVQNVMTVTTE